MKIVVFSDVHGRSYRVEQVLALHPNADAVLFLGDGIRDLPDSVYRGAWSFAGVRGNCDLFGAGNSDFPFFSELTLNLESYTVMMMHGDAYGVKHGTEDAICHAVERGADLLLYGHTHAPEERYLPEGTIIGNKTLAKPLWIMNPGSLGAPRDGVPTYGLVQIRNKQILLSHGTV